VYNIENKVNYVIVSL